MAKIRKSRVHKGEGYFYEVSRNAKAESIVSARTTVPVRLPPYGLATSPTNDIKRSRRILISIARTSANPRSLFSGSKSGLPIYDLHLILKMKSPQIDQIVYECMFPKPKPTDPQNFQGLLQRQLVPEVRLETQAFYGHLSSQEAKYPGLDYSYQPHRNRLSRFAWHRRLFRAFDNLRLTNSEIASLTKWEGTRWAKERFEREQGVAIRDTTSDGIEDWIEPELRVPMAQIQKADVEDMEDIQEEDEREVEGHGNENEGDDDMDEDSDIEIQSVGLELNERLRAAVAQREAGNAATVMDEEWEQWLKDAVEAGGIPFLSPHLSPNANIPGTRPATESQATHPRVLNAARLGQWHQIPDFLHSMVRQNIEASNGPVDNATPSSVPSPWTTTTTSPFLSRHRTSTRSSRVDARIVNRLDNHFAEQFSRRPVPPLPSSTPLSSISTQVTRIDPQGGA